MTVPWILINLDAFRRIISDHQYPSLVAHQLLSKVYVCSVCHPRSPSIPATWNPSVISRWPLCSFTGVSAHRVDEFLSKYPRSNWATGEPTLAFHELKDYITKYQDPQQADSLLKIQKELDETKIVLHKTIESVLQRGEKIDDLVAKSDGLSSQSKMFYRTRPPPSVLSTSQPGR